jgi:hypothetical protein
MQAQPAIPRQDILLGPSPCCGVGGFGVSDLINAGFLTELAPQLAYFSVQHYYMSKRLSYFSYTEVKRYLEQIIVYPRTLPMVRLNRQECIRTRLRSNSLRHISLDAVGGCMLLSPSD